MRLALSLSLALLLGTLQASAEEAAAKPSLRFLKAIGDIRGLGMDNISVTAKPDGGCLLLSSDGRLSEFAPDGRYVKSFKAPVSWPFDKFKVDVVDGMALVGDSGKDFAWAFDKRRAGTSPGKFLNPSDAVEGPDGRVYVADAGNRRVQIFKPEELETPCASVEFKSKPERLAVSKSLMAVSMADGSLAILRREGDGPWTELLCDAKPGQLKALRFRPDGSLLLASQDELKLFKLESDGLSATLKQEALIAPSFKTRWPSLLLNAVPLCKAPDGSICFASTAQGSLISLSPSNDIPVERKGLPKGARALCFVKDGTLVAGCEGAKPGEQRLMKLKISGGALESLGPFCAAPLYEDGNVPLWGLLAVEGEGVYARVVEQGHDKGWPGLAVKLIQPDGKMKDLVSYRSLYAVRSVFSPWEGFYSLKQAKDGEVVLASAQLLSVQKFGADGKQLWEAGLIPQGEASKISFKQPRDMALDSKGRIWIADAGACKILCLSPEGKLLSEFGGPGYVDDVSGDGLDCPSGIAVTEADGAELLYVADSGNRRILKYAVR